MFAANIIAYQVYARRVIALASVVCFLAVVCYGVFLLAAVEKAAAQQRYEGQARDIGNSLAMLETQYLAAENAITADKVEEFGLVPVAVSRIAYIEESAHSFSMR